MSTRCFICRSEVPEYNTNKLQESPIKCNVCGTYRISEPLALRISKGVENSYIYSGAIREHYEQGSDKFVDDLNALLDSVSVPKNPLDSIDRILLYLMKKSTSADEVIVFKETDYPIGYLKTGKELIYLLRKASGMGYLEQIDSNRYRLDTAGWRRLTDLQQAERISNQAFVAMWFDKSLDDAWENGLKPALKQTGYDPIRIDRTEHNEKIDDKIMADIRKSGLLVADFTDHRQGVYFETGFAMGLGIPIIWTCREDHIKKAHFDTRQYNHIVWADSDDLKQRLINRIEAVLPNRPRKSS